MSPRPRKVSDDDVFSAVHRVMQRRGPAQLTLAEIAAEVGVTAGALVQRFGSKRDLMLALTARFAGSSGELFEQLRAADPSPLGALRNYADCIGQMGGSPAALAHHLSYLQIDLTDPDFHVHTLAQARAALAWFVELLDEAVVADELLPGTDTSSLARVVQVSLNGSLMTWAFYQEGSAAEWMRADLDAVLQPYLPVRAPRSKRSRTIAKRPKPVAKKTRVKRKAARPSGGGLMHTTELDERVRYDVYQHFIRNGTAPSANDLRRGDESAGQIEAALRRLADAHHFALVPGTTRIWMAHPFSGVPTAHVVETATQRYWANCAWDSLGIPALLGVDARASTICADCGESLEITIEGAAVRSAGRLVHYAVPPRKFYDDIGFT